MESVIKEATKELTPNPETLKPTIAEKPKESGKNNEASKHVFPATSAADPSPAVVRPPPVQVTPAPTPPVQPSRYQLLRRQMIPRTHQKWSLSKSTGKHKKLPKKNKSVVPEPPRPEPVGPTRRNATKPTAASRGRKERP